MDVEERLIAAFPSTVDEVTGAAHALARGMTLSPDGFEVLVDGERVCIPERLYRAPPAAFEQGAGVVAALFTRHHDGFIRQRALKRLLEVGEPWAVPFLLRLVGEYVEEIIADIDAAFDRLPERHWAAFVDANPTFVRLNASRVASYWDYYYRQIPRDEYVGFRLMKRIARLAQAGAGRSATPGPSLNP